MSLLSTLGEALGTAARSAVDADRHLQRAMAGLIEAAATRYALDPGEQWQPGEPLKLLLAGYAGTRNTGADVRVEEMIRQLRHLLGDEHVDLSILTVEPERSAGYFPTVKQIELPKIFPKFLFDTIHEQHGVIACEGSMFKSRFANALSTMMVGALGLATAENKLSIAYGGEAGAMDPPLQDLVRRYVDGSLLVVRTPESAAVLGTLGLEATVGTDTAWSYQPGPPAGAEALLEQAGWAGEPVIALCPINAFWWPVRPDVVKGAVHALTGAHARSHYASVYFHADGEQVEQAQDAYVAGLAEAARHARDTHGMFPICVGMEALDRSACEDLAERLGGAPVFVADTLRHPAMVALLHRTALVVSSRYHACVTSMPGSVPSIGVTMDERIRNLMADRGTPELSLEVDDPALGRGLAAAIDAVQADRDTVVAGIERCVADNLRRMGFMGQVLVDHVRERHPEFPLRDDLGRHGDPLDHLPPLAPNLADLLARSTP